MVVFVDSVTVGTNAEAVTVEIENDIEAEQLCIAVVISVEDAVLLVFGQLEIVEVTVLLTPETVIVLADSMAVVVAVVTNIDAEHGSSSLAVTVLVMVL